MGYNSTTRVPDHLNWIFISKILRLTLVPNVDRGVKETSHEVLLNLDYSRLLSIFYFRINGREKWKGEKKKAGDKQGHDYSETVVVDSKGFVETTWQEGLGHLPSTSPTPVLHRTYLMETWRSWHMACIVQWGAIRRDCPCCWLCLTVEAEAARD